MDRLSLPLLFVLAHANLLPKSRSSCSGPRSGKRCCSKLVDNDLFVQLFLSSYWGWRVVTWMQQRVAEIVPEVSDLPLPSFSTSTLGPSKLSLVCDICRMAVCCKAPSKQWLPPKQPESIISFSFICEHFCLSSFVSGVSTHVVLLRRGEQSLSMSGKLSTECNPSQYITKDQPAYETDVFWKENTKVKYISKLLSRGLWSRKQSMMLF